jgi:hypothetical protein
MECVCRGADNPHVHHFVESAALKELSPGTEVDLELNARRRTLRVRSDPKP